MIPEKRGIKSFFTKPKDPKELVRKWQATLRSEARKVDRQIRDIEREKTKAQAAVKEAAQRKDMGSAKILAKELVRTKRSVTQLHTNKAHMIAMQTSLSEQLALVKVAGSLQMSSEVMASVNKLMKVPQLMETVQDLSKEMIKAGLIEELMQDAIDDTEDIDEFEEATDQEVNKILQEIAGETMAQLPKAIEQKQEEAVVAPAEEDGTEIEELQARLNTIRN